MLKLVAKSPRGMVYLVGAGTGDPELLTVKALRIIESAYIIFYDRLVSAEICKLFPTGTPTRYVGKARGKEALPQNQINRMMFEAAMSGLTVCRLKGGDSFIFGRGSEEMLMLKRKNISVEVVPGITAASGCTSYAGIPLTHRGLSQSCTFVTGTCAKACNINWAALSRLNQTLVFYMGLENADSISLNLVDNGLDAGTPAALIENGSTPQQRVVSGRLCELSAMTQVYQIQSPALIVVGDVVNLAGELQWFQEGSHIDHTNHQPSALER